MAAGRGRVKKKRGEGLEGGSNGGEVLQLHRLTFTYFIVI